jgi:hypothetical protein
MKSFIYKEIEELRTYFLLEQRESAIQQLHEIFKQPLGNAALELIDAICVRYGENRFELLNLPRAETVQVDYSKITSLSELDNIKSQKGISIVTCCMNRNDNLKKGLKTWLQLPVDEIIIVDWSSTPPVAETLKDIVDPRVKIIRVENEPRWILTYGFNVGLRFASYEKIYKLDADIEVTSDFLIKNSFDDNEFVRGHWKSALDNGQDDQVYVNGSFGCYKKHLAEIGYYNEFIRTYGWDDSDIYSRLANLCGLKTKYLSSNSIVHMEQAQEERLANQAVVKNKVLGVFEPTELLNQRNKYLVSLYDRWDFNYSQNYSVEVICSSITLYRMSESYELPPYVYEDAIFYGMLELLTWKYNHCLQKINNMRFVVENILEQYHDGIDFDVTAALFGFESHADAHFTESLEGFLFKEHTNSVIVTIGDKRQVLHLDYGNKSYKILFLTKTNFNEIYTFRTENKDGLAVQEVVTIKSEMQTFDRVFSTSVFDEKKEHRLNEYLHCISQNIKHFDKLVLFYEKFDGSFQESVKNIISNQKGKCAEVYFVIIEERPKFDYLFKTVDILFPNTLHFCSNADIVFDETIYSVNKSNLDNQFFVLSRQELKPKTKSTDGFIMNQFGLPNTLSADVWAYKTPLRHDFRADFGIGVFHCDSFLNYHISKSGYDLYNPCLSINCFHVHDPIFNSSEEKSVRLEKEIAYQLNVEIEKCGGVIPIKGVQWCRLEDTLQIKRANQLVDWSDVMINIDVRADGSNLLASLTLALMALKINSYVNVNNCKSVWLRIPEEAVNSEVADILFSFKQLIENKDLLIGIQNKGKSELFENIVEAYETLEINSYVLINNYHAVINKKNQALYSSKKFLFTTEPSFGVHDKAFLLCNVDSDLNDLETYALLKSLNVHEKGYLNYVLSKLCEQGFSALKPYSEDLSYITDEEIDYSIVELLYISNSTKVVEQSITPYVPQISFVTSIFKGSEFFKGFLENTAAAMLECNGEMILVDAASPSNDFEIYKEFINKYPMLSNQIKYIKLNEDPGLYNCWSLGIENAKAAWVGNANLDDRRSPFQARKMLHVLTQNHEYKGAAAAIRATRARNTGWYEITDNEYWFNNGFEQAITFDTLYIKDDKGLVKSQNVMHCMPIWHKSLHDKYGYFDEETYGTSADWAFWLKCTKAGEKFCLVPQVLSQYYINEQSHNRVNDPNGIKENRIVNDYLSVLQTAFEQQ